ncbi:MAG: phosphoenolpyruvate carboxykinase (GTP) [Candidatus Sumerlaeota bacterium]|nr:phosphoenolpyruvate carboxykinase (GTP) [Candidatus Sumerlaeota bacterium]
MPDRAEHRELRLWVEQIAQLCQPDKIHWMDGSEKEKEALENEACSTGELTRLNPDVLPGCFYHRTAENDVARTEHLTFICTPHKKDAGPTNNWLKPEDGYRQAAEILAGSMKGRTMYVIPFSMGPVGSPFSKIGVQITDSIYVALNMRIMTRVGDKVLKKLGAIGEFTRCVHGKAQVDDKKRLILHFPQDNAIWSVGSGYGGNALLGKKCLSLRIASHLAHEEGWLAEHMLIMGVEDPDGRVFYIAAAFPSACGKTNLAMLVPPKGLKEKGYRIWTLGDDIAWMRIDTDGQLWAVNPEYGFFGVAPGTNAKSNPNAMAAIKRNTIFTNVLLKPDQTIWWEGHDDPAPPEGINWRGRKWTPGMANSDGTKEKAAHPNSRFTAPITQCPTISTRVEHHHGVLISAIVFGGRRAQLAPLVYQSFNWQHGIFVGATMASEMTAAAVGATGQVRRDPMAMLPFCGYNMGDYFRHWLDVGRSLEVAPRIFHVNWFRQDDSGKFLWPGFGDNLRVLEWIIDRCRGNAHGVETPIGNVPAPDSLDLTGLDISQETMKRLLTVDRVAWRKETEEIKKFFDQIGDRLPGEMLTELNALRGRLGE